jgi:hypothetical protein
MSFLRDLTPADCLARLDAEVRDTSEDAIAQLEAKVEAKRYLIPIARGEAPITPEALAEL